MVGIGTSLESRRGDDDDRECWIKGFNFAGEIVAANIVQTSIQNDSVNGWKTPEGLQRLFTAVCCEDVELGSFNHEFTG